MKRPLSAVSWGPTGRVDTKLAQPGYIGGAQAEVGRGFSARAAGRRLQAELFAPVPFIVHPGIIGGESR